MKHEFDIVIVGAGVSGMRVALDTGQKYKVAVLTKVYPVRSHSGAAQGGINAALANLNKKDTCEDHMFHTIKGSDYLGDQDAIEHMTYAAPSVVRELEHMGVLFSRFPDGTIAQRPIGRKRACYAGDYTGHVILHTMWEHCLKHNVKFFSEFQVFDLIIKDGKCCGVVAFEMATGKFHIFHAKIVVLATGGYGRAFKITTNAHANTGDGLSLVYNCGLPIEDIEFVQFHPTGIYQSGILVTEGSRAEGAYLINGQGRRFMEDYAPQHMETAPRDVVSRSITTEINEGRGIDGKSYVYLDLRHIGEKKISERLPQIRQLCIEFANADPVYKPVPIQPTCHYSMGGIPTNIDAQVISDTKGTIVPGLYATGECACVSVHGANRLGGNSLLEAVYFGIRAGKKIIQQLDDGIDYISLPENPDDKARERFSKIINNKGKENPAEIRAHLQETMTENCGIFRDAEKLQKQTKIIHELQEKASAMSIKDKSKVFNTDLLEAAELQNLLLFSEVIVFGALNRQESRGSHFRTDFPKRNDDEWLRHSFYWKQPSGRPKQEFKPVKITKYQPKAREY